MTTTDTTTDTTSEGAPMTTDPLYLVVDMAHDLMLSGDETYRLLLDIADGDEPAQEVDGFFVDEVTADLYLRDYVSAWEDAWLATAEAMGHEAITANGGSPEAHAHIRRNRPEALDWSETGWSAVKEAWERVWNACPTITLTRAVAGS